MEKPEPKQFSPEESLPPAEVLALQWQIGLAGYFLGLVAFSGLFVTPLAMGPWFVAGAALIFAFLLSPGWSGRVPTGAWRVGQVLIVATFVLDIFIGGSILDALVRLNILLVTYRVISPRSRRDDNQLVLVTLFLIIISGVFSVSAWFFPQILMFTAGTMFFLRRVNRLENMGWRQAYPESWRFFSWGLFLRHTKGTQSLLQWIVGVGGFFFLVGLSSLIFIIIPRLDLDSRFDFLQVRSAQGLSGFSEEMGLQDITNILQDNTPALRVDPSGEVFLPVTPYWRMLVFDEYREGRFRLSRSVAQEQVAWRGRRATPGDFQWDMSATGPTDREARWTFFLQPGVSRYLPLGGPFTDLRFQEEQSFRQVPSLQMIGQPIVNGSIFIYEFRGKDLFAERIADPDFASRLADAEEGEYPQTTLALPINEASRQYLREVNTRLRGDENLSDLAYARRVSEYLQERHGYSLQSQVPGGDKDIVVRWMESGNPAHCEFFAAGLVLLLREQEIPSRVAVGFAGGRRNAFEGHITVRYSDAHAWVEVYYDGFWHRVDPTPSADGDEGPSGGDNDERGLTFLQDTGFGAFLDGMRMLWYRRIVSFDEAEQTDFFSRQRERLQALGEEIKEVTTGFRDRVLGWLRGPWDFSRIVQLAGFGLLLMLVIPGWKLLRWRWRLWWWQFRRKPSALHPLRIRAGKALRKISEHPPQESESVADYERVKAELLLFRYGPESQWPEFPVRSLEKLWDQLK